MNLEAVEFLITFIDHLAILVLKYVLPNCSHGMHRFANNKSADEIIWDWGLSGIPMVSPFGANNI
jgi:hypothetical protein